MPDGDFPQPEDYRIYFAGQIMPAIVVDAMRHNASIEHPHLAIDFDEMAQKAVIAADALIAALKR